MPSSQPPTPLKLLAALALTAAVLVVGSTSAFRKVETFQPLGFEARPEAGHWLVTEAEPVTGLAAGDQIVLVNGDSFPRVGPLESALKQSSTAELVVVRAETLETITYALPPLAIDWAYLVLAAIGCGYLLIGLYTLLRHRERPSLLFHLWCLTSAAVYLISVEPPFSQLFARAAYLTETVALFFLAPLTLHLFSVFPRLLTPTRALRRLIPFYYLPATLLLGFQLDLLLFGGRLFSGGEMVSALAALDRLELYHLVAFSLAAAAVLGWRVWRTGEREPQRQSVWIALGMAAGYLPFLFVYLLPREIGLVLPKTLTTLAVLPLALVPVTFAYAILRYKLWDIGVVVRDSLALSLTVLVGVIGFSLANLTINRLVPSELELPKNLLVFTSGLAIAGLMVPTRRGLGRSLERLQYRSRYGARRGLNEFGQQLLYETDPAVTCDKLRAKLEHDLEIAPVNLLVLQGDSLVAGRAETGLGNFLPASDLPDEIWKSDVETLSGIEFPTVELSAENRLYAAGYRYAFPLKVRTHRLGLVLTGHKEGDIPLSSDDLDLLRSLFNQVGLAIENSQLLRQVRRQLDEVSRLQQFNEQIIQSSPAGIAVVDAEGRVMSSNAALANLLGVAADAIEGEPLSRFLPIDPIPRAEDGLREMSFRADDGRERYFQVSAAALSRGEGNGRRVVVVQEITDRVAMENALKERERLASLGMLAAGVAHEVNTPITGISSYAQMLLAETPEGDPRRELLQKVEKQTFRAARIVNHLLDFARDDDSERRAVELAPMVDETLDLLSDRIAESGVELEWSPPAEPIAVHGDEGELQQVLTNLVVNALDAMKETAGNGDSTNRLAVTLEADPSWVSLTVADTGPGIATSELESIFQPFYSTKLKTGGTGLGLSISYNIVRKHGGELRVASSPGAGSRFIVELPRQTNDEG